MTENRQITYKSEVLRKGIHLLSLSIPVVYAMISKATALWILVPLAFLFVVIDILGHKKGWIRNILLRYFETVMRNHELKIPPFLGQELRRNPGLCWVGHRGRPRHCLHYFSPHFIRGHRGGRWACWRSGGKYFAPPSVGRQHLNPRQRRPDHAHPDLPHQRRPDPALTSSGRAIYEDQDCTGVPNPTEGLLGTLPASEAAPDPRPGARPIAQGESAGATAASARRIRDVGRRSFATLGWEPKPRSYDSAR